MVFIKEYVRKQEISRYMQAAIRNDYTPQECLISYFKSAATIVISKRPNYEQYKYALECPLTSKKKLIFN